MNGNSRDAGATGSSKRNGGSSLRAVLMVLFVLLPVAAIVVVGFVLYYNWRWDSLASRHYRALANVSAQLGETLSATESAFDAAGAMCKQEHWACRPTDEQIRAGATLEGIPRLTFVKDASKLGHGEATAKGTRVTPSVQAALVERRDGSLSYYLSYGASGESWTCKTSAKDPTDESLMCTLEKEPQREDQLCTRLDVGAVIEQLVESEGIEADVFLASVDGEVYFQRRGRQNLIHNLAKLSERCEEPLVANPFANEEKREKDPSQRQLTPGRVDRLCYRNQEHAVVVAPIRLTLAATGGASSPAPRLVLASLTPIAELSGAASAVPPLWPTAVALGVMLIALSWPVLKLWTMGPRERLSGSEIRILVLSGVLFSALVTLLICDFALHDAISGSFDTQMDELADDVKKRFLGELREARTFLAEFAATRQPPDQRFKAFTDAVLVSSDGIAKRRWTSEIDERTGTRRVSENRPPTFPIADRQYFKEAIAGPWWGLGLAHDPSAPRIAVEAVRSRVTTAFSVVLATALRPSSDGIALVALPMASLDQPVLPAGLSFAIVDQAGLVQLHSTSGKNLGENLVQECDQNSELSSALRARRSDSMSGSCYRQQQRIRVKPIKNTPWSIVVLREKGLFQTVYFDIAMIWLALFAIYLLCFLVLLLLLQIVKEGYRAPWLWPNRSHPPRYLLATLCLVSAAAFGVWSTGSLSVTGAIVGLIALPAACTALLCLVLGDGSSPGERWLAASVAAVAAIAMLAVALREEKVEIGLVWLACLATWLAPWLVSNLGRWPKERETFFRFSYALLLLAYLGVLAIMPSLVFYRDARDYAVTAFIRHGQLAFQQARVERAKKLRARFIGERRSAGVTERLIREQLSKSGARTAPGVFPTSWLGWAAPSRQPGCDPMEGATLLSDLVVGEIPSYNEAAAAIRRAACERASDAAWSWSSTRNGQGGFDFEISDLGLVATLGSKQAASIHARHEEDPFALSLRYGIAIAVGGIVLLLGLALLWAIARLVFLLSVDRQGRVGESGPSSDPESRLPRLFRFSTAGSGEPGPEGSAVIDLRSLEKEEELRALLDHAKITDATAADVHHLEAGLRTPGYAKATLEGLATACDAGIELRLFSEVDPLSYLADQLQHGPAEEGTVEKRAVLDDSTMHAWSLFLARFGRSVIPADVAPAGFYETLQPAPDEIDAERSLPGRNKSLWIHSTRSEQLALRHLAEEGFLSPADQEVARSLMERGLLYRTPAFELLDESFRRFVLGAMSYETCRRLEQDAAGSSAWSQLKGPLSILVVLVAVFVMVTQREAFYTTIGIASAVAAALPRIIGLFGRLGEESSSRS